MNGFLLALIIWSLPFFGVSCGSTPIQSSSSAQTQPTPTPEQETMTLTDKEVVQSFPLTPDQVSHLPEVLEVSVTKVVNPASTPVSIFVYLAPVDDKRKAEGVELGNFSLYPVDRPGKFMLSAQAALAKSSKPSPSRDDRWKLNFVMRLPEQNKSNVEVTIARPNWKN